MQNTWVWDGSARVGDPIPGEMGSIRPIFLKFWEPDELLRHLFNRFPGLIGTIKNVSSDFGSFCFGASATKSPPRIGAGARPLRHTPVYRMAPIDYALPPTRQGARIASVYAHLREAGLASPDLLRCGFLHPRRSSNSPSPPGHQGPHLFPMGLYASRRL